MKRALGFFAVSLVMFIAGLLIWQKYASGPAAFQLDKRPQKSVYLFDYAEIISGLEEGAEDFLESLEKRFQIEALIITLPDLAAADSIQNLAVDLVNRWRIGAEFEGRGLLLLLVAEGNQVKLEVAYELEDVFTDAYAGYIEDLQLKPYFRNDDLGTGLLAVMELLEQRAEIKHQGDYSAGQIQRLDDGLLAGGAGATRQLKNLPKEQQPSNALPPVVQRGAETPAEAWQIMLQKWAGQGQAQTADIYTEMTKMAMGDQNRPDQRTRADLPHWQQAGYQVRQDRNYALISFGNKKGWNNAPFIFCNTGAGWKFDIVYQRRLVVMGPNPSWKIQQGSHPYRSLLDGLSQSTRKDLPMPDGDWYDCGQDQILAEEIRRLERQLDLYPDDFPAMLKLIRLNVITGRRPNHVLPLIKRARSIDPSAPAPLKYAAIYNVNVFFQYETALKDIKEYNRLQPDDVFGYNFLGFLYYRLSKYQQSLSALEHAISLDTDNVYAYCLMARNYALLHRDASRLDPRRKGYRDAVFELLAKAQVAPGQDPIRVAWLNSWLKQFDL